MRWILFVPLLVLLVLFALSNPQDVEIRLWPFDLAWVSSLGIAVLLIAAVAFLIGALIAWGAALPARRRAARMEQAARLLEGELASYRAREEQARRDASTGRVPPHEILPASGGTALTTAGRH
jgi:putative membrane protein